MGDGEMYPEMVVEDLTGNAKGRNEHDRCTSHNGGLLSCKEENTAKSWLARSTVNRGKSSVTALANYASGARYVDTLHNSTEAKTPCSGTQCKGSLVYANKRTGTDPRTAGVVLDHAKDFLNQYFTHIRRSSTEQHLQRINAVIESISATGSYQLTEDELLFGAKLAWRNAPRCIGRIQWTKLQLFDARHVKTCREMFSVLCSHLKYASNGGNIRSAITVFPQRTDGLHDFRVWNPLMIKYAGYEQPDGSVIGDPANVEFTKICQGLGWKGCGGRFDILPLVLQANGEDPEWFELPEECVLQVQLCHPEYDWFAELGLQWYGVPAVSNMLLDVGGIEFPACPFNGWFMSTEIGCRNLCDSYRYNLLETVATKMGLQTTSNASLWKDKALVEVNLAVLHSYQKAHVTITDHHSASESFIVHMQQEQKLRGGCPADWVWVVPPMSSSVCPVFHQEMLCYSMKPSFDYQVDAWVSRRQQRENKRKISFKAVAEAVYFVSTLMKTALRKRISATVLYSTETGRSKQFAERINQMLSYVFNSRVVCMEDYDLTHLKNETLLLIVTSTFGNGDPPENGEGFAQHIGDLVRGVQGKEHDRFNGSIKLVDLESLPLANIRYSVFGLGSSAYPHFCAFAHAMDDQLGILGGERLLEIAEGDELGGQEAEFSKWADAIYKEACNTFSIKHSDTNRNMLHSKSVAPDSSWAANKFRVAPEAQGVKAPDVHAALHQLCGKQPFPCKLISCQNLQSPSSGRATVLVKLDTNGEEKLLYEAGDHAAVFPTNRADLVRRILGRINCEVPPDQLMKLECRIDEDNDASNKKWSKFQHLPVCSLRQALSCFLEIAKPPSSQLLKIMATFASDPGEKETLANLGLGDNEYEDYVHSTYPTLADVFDRFPSLRVPAALLLTQLPLLKPRYYSISSSPNISPGEIHLTIAVVWYKTQGGEATRHGVCSNWFTSITQDDVVPVFIKTATKFHMPEDKTAPMILIGPGAGIAPFRSFWQQRQFDLLKLAQSQALTTNQDRAGLGDMTLVFGCRRSSQDNIYKLETQQAKAKGVLKDVWTAYSRDPDHPKAYAQDLLLMNSQRVFETISRFGGHIYVCGDVTMAADVAEVIQSILADHGGMSEEEAKKWMTSLRDENRYHEDIFGIRPKTVEVTREKQNHKKRSNRLSKLLLFGRHCFIAET